MVGERAYRHFLSVATRQSVAAVGGTVIYAMGLQWVAVIHAISGVDPHLLTNQLNAWHSLFESPFHIGPILRATWVSIVFALPPLIAALVIFNRRDVADRERSKPSLTGASSAGPNLLPVWALGSSWG